MIKLSADKTIGLKIKSDATVANGQVQSLARQINSLSDNLKKVGYQIKSIKELSDKTGEYSKATIIATNGTAKLTQTIDKMGNTIKKVSVTNLTKETGKLKNSMSSLFSLGKLYAAWNVTKRLRDYIKQMVTNAIDFIETTNKFEVSLGEAFKGSGYKFVNTIAEKFGLAREELMNYQSTYNNIMKSLPGITNEAAYGISEGITKMAIDYASLFNVSTISAMEKFQSALVGNVKSIRTGSGFDITETTIGEKAKELGVEKPVRQLNQMEKRLLRIIVLMDQMKRTGAMGDFARTIEQPSNQLKILSNQIKELGIWIGNVFMTTIGKILPYINGFVMALKEMVKMLAILVGYENTGSVTGGIEESAEGIETNLGGAVSKAKELKKTLMGFDVLNVIQKPSSDSGGAGGSINGVDPKISGAVKKYENMMENVRMKAIDIRDRILEWLGYTWDLDEAGNIVNLRLKDGYQNIEKIRDILLFVAGAAVLIKLITGVATIVKAFGVLKGLLFGSAAVGKSAGLLGVVTKIITALKAPIIGTILSFKIAPLASLLSVLAPLLGIIAPIVAAIWGITELSKPIADLSVETLVFGENISNATKNAVKPFIEKMQELGTTIWGLELGGIVKQEDVERVKNQTAEITRVLEKGIVDKYAELEKQISDVNLFPDAKKREEYLNTLKISMQHEKDMVKFYNDKINDIVAKAAKENRELTELERVEIEGIRKQMAESGINNLSATQEEAISIKAKFNENFYKLEVQQVADAIKQAKELKDKTIEQAKEEYDKKIALAEKMKETVPGFTQEMYEQMTSDAKKQLDKQLEDAEKTYEDIVNEAQTKYPEVTKTIDLETGKIKNGWQIAGDYIKEKANEISDSFKKVWQSAKDGAKTKWEEIKKDFEDFKNKLNEKIANIKKKWKEFKDSFTLPKIKTPHFTWTSTPATGWVKTVLEALNIPASIPKLNVNWYANGGFPAMGEMFVAREAGPELVGSIGNKSAVVNNDQIVESVSRGVAQAVSSVMGNNSGNIKLYIDGQEITNVVTQRQNRMANITGMGW